MSQQGGPNIIVIALLGGAAYLAWNWYQAQVAQANASAATNQPVTPTTPVGVYTPPTTQEQMQAAAAANSIITAQGGQADAYQWATIWNQIGKTSISNVNSIFFPNGLPTNAAAVTQAGGTPSQQGLPLMSLAIPGTATTAILLSGFMMFGLQPGPSLFTQHPDVAWGIIASMYMGNVMLVIMNIAAIPFFVWVIKKATPFMIPLVIALLVAGGYSMKNSMNDVWITVGSGVVGYLLVKLKFPLVSILLGVVLGGMAETNFRQALRISDGSMLVFLQRPICVTMLVIGLLMLLSPAVMGFMRKGARLKKA